MMEYMILSKQMRFQIYFYMNDCFVKRLPFL